MAIDRVMPVCSLTSRSYETERDLQQMYELLMEARSRTDDWRYWHVGEGQAIGRVLVNRASPASGSLVQQNA